MNLRSASTAGAHKLGDCSFIASPNHDHLLRQPERRRRQDHPVDQRRRCPRRQGPQGSPDRRRQAGSPRAPGQVCATSQPSRSSAWRARTWRRRHSRLAADFAFTIIDGPPHAEQIARSCIIAADFVAVPIEPSGLSTWASDLTAPDRPSLACAFARLGLPTQEWLTDHNIQHTTRSPPTGSRTSDSGRIRLRNQSRASSSRISSRRGRTPRSRPAAAPNPRLARLPERFEAEA